MARVRAPGTRQLALEMLLVLAEHKPTQMRNTPGFVVGMLQAITQFMTEIEDEAAWHTADEVSPPPAVHARDRRGRA